ncbi:GNAT family N-acetyltransferase [Paucilactobacillus kaifaensis]|uniref:GNAT family N-acetyltransferase n=1 Tax=Paucilactobacillus kaifaensis TaxID=2559921 RepID=UPI0010F7CBCB|nr:GNAT family N-acetyltransferase [Paucilactobacillus kaifaensis]
MQFQYDDGRIYAEDIHGELLGEIVFPAVEQGSSDVVVERTFVSPAARGQGLAAQLVAEFVKYATDNHLHAKLLCPYAKKEFGNHPEYQQLLAPEDRF